MKWLNSKLEKPKFKLTDYGTLKLEKSRNTCYWFGSINFANPNTQIELLIEVENESEPSGEQIEALKEFESNWYLLSDKLFEYMSICFKDTKWEKDKEALSKMYYLSGIELKKDQSECWIILEPNFNVESIFNFLPRFTIKDEDIIWSNIKTHLKCI